MRLPTLEAAVLARLREDLGGEDAVREVLASYLAEAPLLVATARDAARRGDAPALERAAHTLKGLSATVGAMALAGLARALEEAGGAGGGGVRPAELDALEAEWARVRAALEGA